MTKEQLVTLIYKALPYSEQIKDLDFSSEADAVRFNWRGTKFRVDSRFSVDEVDDGMLKGSDFALVVGELVKRTSMMSE